MSVVVVCRVLLLALSLCAASGTHAPVNTAKAVRSYIYAKDKSETPAARLLSCNFTTPQSFDPPMVLQKLYGPYFDKALSGKGSLLILGQHNSGTSMLARLLMLMGAFQGNVHGLSTSPTNRLKYWEIIDVTHFHDIVLSWVSDHNFKPYHAQGVNMGLLSDDRKQTISCFAKKTVRNLDRHRPWVLKDPRMLLFAEQWIQHMLDPVCIVVFREPISNALSLSDNSKKSAASEKFQPMSPERWLRSWEEGMLSALRACEDHPTILLQLEDMREDLIRFTYKLYALLGQADVFYLQIPPRNILHSEFETALKPKHRDDKRQPFVSLSKSQEALYRSLLMVANSANMGLSDSTRRAAAVLELYEDAMS
eukprot:jgi/Ulvmu1/4212/UM019_0191.1